MDQLKKDDPILQYDLIDCFNESMDKLKQNFGWQSPLVSQDAGILGPVGSVENLVEK